MNEFCSLFLDGNKLVLIYRHHAVYSASYYTKDALFYVFILLQYKRQTVVTQV